MVKTKGANSKSLRQSNKATILWRLYCDGAMSRIALAKALNLSGAAITILIKELVEEGLVIESGEKLQRNVSGRKEVIVDINYDNLLAYNVNIEKDKTHFSICSLKGVIKEQIKDTKEYINRADKAEYIAHALCSLGSYKVIGIGIGISGYIEGDIAVRDFINNINELTNATMRLGIPLYLSNNVKAHAKAIINSENTDFVYIKHGPGLGSAIVCCGDLIEGANNHAGEIGQSIIRVDNNNNIVTLESYVAESSIIKRYQDISGKIIPIKDLYNMRLSNAAAKKVIDECIDIIVQCIFNTATLIDPSAIILSGGMFDNDDIFDVVKNKLKNLSKVVIKKVSAREIKSYANARLVFDNIIFR